jgi:hypothetical protein
MLILVFLRYLKSLPDKDELVDNTLVYLLNRSLHASKATKSDVKRVYAIHASLISQNLQNAATENLRQLLLRAARSRLYLKCTEGIKFITFLVKQRFSKDVIICYK